MEHSHETQNSSKNFVNRHLILLFLVVALGIVVYFITQNPSSVLIGTLLSLAATLLIVGIVFFLARGVLGSIVQRLHGVPKETQTHGHSHNHDALETTGETISWARFYDWLVQLVMGGQERKLREATVRLANLQTGEKALDVGCGTGTLVILAKQKSHPSIDLTGMDASPQMINRAKQKAAEAGVNVHFEASLAEKLNAPDNHYDIVMNSLVMHHLPPELQPLALAEMFRVLKVGGRLLIVDFEPPQDGLLKIVLRLLLGDGMMHIDNSKLPKLLAEAGFTEITLGNTGLKLATYASAKKSD